MKAWMKPLVLGVSVLCSLFLIIADVEGAPGRRIRWDIVSVDSNLVLRPGAEATAAAVNNSRMTMTGSGTFREGMPTSAAGGGTWTLFDASGNSVGGGTYTVIELVNFVEAPGTLPATFTDTIDRNRDARSGLGHFRISYSDGSEGILIVSCHLPEGTPDSIVEGINVSKEFTQFFTPVSGITVYHLD